MTVIQCLCHLNKRQLRSSTCSKSVWNPPESAVCSWTKDAFISRWWRVDRFRLSEWATEGLHLLTIHSGLIHLLRTDQTREYLFFSSTCLHFIQDYEAKRPLIWGFHLKTSQKMWLCLGFYSSRCSTMDSFPMSVRCLHVYSLVLPHFVQ